MTAGVALALVFVGVELRRRHPLLDVRLFTRPDFTTSAAGITFLFFANFGFFFVVMQYMQLILGYSPSKRLGRWRRWRYRSSHSVRRCT